MSKHHQETSAPFVERLIFNNRIVVLLLFSLLTLFFGYQAAQVKPDTSFEKMIPLKHPYIANMIEHQNDLPNLGNTIRIAWRSRTATSSPPSTWKPSSVSTMRCSSCRV